MEPKPNEKLLFNVLLLLNNMHAHVTLSSNMNQFKFVLFVNSNVSVLPKLTHKLTSNNTELNFSMLPHSYNKLGLPVLSKISYVETIHFNYSYVDTTPVCAFF